MTAGNLSVLRDRRVLALFSARSLSLLGNAMAPVAIAFAVLDSPGGSATSLGLVLAARLVTQVVFLLYGGIVADRFPRHRIMIVAELAAAAAQGTIAVLFITQRASLALVALLATVNGMATALFEPASRAVLPQLVTGDKLQAANALLRFSMNTGSIVGASLAGILVATIGPGPTLAVDAATFLVSAILLMFVRVPAVLTPSGASLVTQLREGWREFTSTQWVWAMVAQLAIANICVAGGFVVLGPVVAKAHLGGAPAWGAILTAQAVGFIMGSVTAMKLRPRYPVRAAALFTIGFTPPFFALAVPTHLIIIGAAMFVTGMCIDIYEVLFETAIQHHVPPESLSRVMSYESTGTFLFIPLGLAIAGPIADLAGVGPTLVGGGVVIIASALLVLMLPSVRGARRPDAEPDDGAEPDAVPDQPALNPQPSGGA